MIAFLPIDFIGEAAREQDLVLIDCEGPEMEMHTVMAIRNNNVMLGDKIDAIDRVKTHYVQHLDAKNMEFQYNSSEKFSIAGLHTKMF